MSGCVSADGRRLRRDPVAARRAAGEAAGQGQVRHRVQRLLARGGGPQALPPPAADRATQPSPPPHPRLTTHLSLVLQLTGPYT